MLNQSKILIIFNPLAGKKYRDKYQKFFLKHFDRFSPNTPYDWLDTEANLHQQLAKVDFKSYQKIIVIGGDGTIREVADFLIKHKLDLPLAIIPEGSANILASNLNIPQTMIKAIQIACTGREKIIDVGLINQQLYFVVCLSLGLWSKIIKETNRGLKIRLGNLAYILTFLKHSKKYRTVFKFTLDGQDYQIPGNTMVIANALSIFKIKPAASIDFSDGQLEILIFQNTSIWGLLVSVVSLIFSKKKFPFLTKLKGQTINIWPQTVQEDHLQLDGEAIKLDQINLEVVPQKLRVIIP